MKKLFYLTALLCIIVISLSISAFCEEDSSNALTQPTPVPTLGKWEQYWLDRVNEFKEENNTLDPDKKYIVVPGRFPYKSIQG